MSKRYDALVKSAGEADSYVNKYPHVLTRFQKFWERRHEWALSYRVDKPMRNNHTNNYAEAGIRVLKEIIFGHVKSYNLVQMFDFIVTLMEKYYVNRLLDIAHSRYRPGIALKFRQLQKLTNTVSNIEQHSQDIYCVTECISDSNFDFLVDTEIGTCSCLTGCSGAPCKHQAAVAMKFSLPSLTLPPVFSSESRLFFAKLASGEGNTMELEFYSDLRTLDSSEQATNLLQGRQVNVPQEPDENEPLHMNDDDLLSQQNGAHQSDIQEDPVLATEVDVMFSELTSIFKDVTDRVKAGDTSLISGLCKFIQTLKKLQHSHSPGPAISYALHNFGKSDRKCDINDRGGRVITTCANYKYVHNCIGYVWSNGRRGKYIKTNSTGIARRRKGLSRGTKMAAAIKEDTAC